MIYPIFIYGQPVLRKKAEPVEKDYPGLAEIIANMWETMYVSDGVGLAAPQVGLSLRIFVIDGTALAEDHPEAKDFKQTFLNAEILEESGDPWYYNEGCLSVPGIREDVSRKPVIKIRFQDEQFKAHTKTFSGVRARIIQHEYDHIEGKLLIDNVSLIRKQLLRKKLNDLINGNLNVNYKVSAVKK
jgi:peptide deformylase